MVLRFCKTPVSGFWGTTEPQLTPAASVVPPLQLRKTHPGCLGPGLTTVATLSFFCNLWPWLIKAEKQAVFCFLAAQMNLFLMRRDFWKAS